MALAKGIRAQQSRFAALSIDSDSGSDGEEEKWHEVLGTRKKEKCKTSPQQQQQQQNEKRPMSKSAKKRARKKRNQSASSESADGGAKGESGTGEDGREPEAQEIWQQKNEEALDEEFQKDLEQAILRSKLEAEQQAEIAKERRAAEILAKSIKSKKGVTLSLHELHRGPDRVKTSSAQATQEVENLMESPPDSLFFEKVEEEVRAEVGRERSHERRRLPSSGSLQSPDAEENPRVAHLMDELEKRDKAISELIKRNKELKSSLKEVKERNQSLCRIMSHGEFSTKADLVQQNEDLSSMKNELTDEITTLRTALEQERTKNKALRTELTKLQGAKGSGGSKSTNHSK